MTSLAIRSMFKSKETYEPVVEDDAEERQIRDQELLWRLGKKPILKRTFGFVTILGFTSTITVLWESVLLLMDSSLQNGGPEGFIYGFIVVWIGCLALFACLSELASMAPTAGGQYHWVAMMSPNWCQRFLSFVDGWMAVIGWQGASVGRTLLSSRIILGLAKLCHPEYKIATWHISLLAVALVAFAMLLNVVGGQVLPRFEGMVLALHLIGFCAVLVPLLALGTQMDTASVFNVFNNGGNLPTDGLAFFMGLQGLMYAFIGGDGAIHMSEEIQNAPVIVPRGIMLNYLVNGVMAFGISIAVLYSRGTLEQILDPLGGFAIIEIIQENVRSNSGAAIMVSIIAVLQISAGVSNYTSATRILWGFARDKGLPGWRKIQEVEERTTVPFYACLITAAINAILSFLPLGSVTAFNNVISIAVAGLYGSYLVACGLLLHRRWTGAITPYNPRDKDTVNTVGFRLAWGPWRLPGAIGIIINAFAVVYLVSASTFIFWPVSLPVNLQNMNWSSAIFGGIMILAIFYYFIWGHYDYYGPVVETATGRVSRHSHHPSMRLSARLSSQTQRASPLTIGKKSINSFMSGARTVSDDTSLAVTAIEDLDCSPTKGTFGRPPSFERKATPEPVTRPEQVHPALREPESFYFKLSPNSPDDMIPLRVSSVRSRPSTAASPCHSLTSRYSADYNRSWRASIEKRTSNDWYGGGAERSRTMDDRISKRALASLAKSEEENAGPARSRTMDDRIAKRALASLEKTKEGDAITGALKRAHSAGMRRGGNNSFAPLAAQRAPSQSAKMTERPSADLSAEQEALEQGDLTGTARAMKKGTLGLLAKGI